MVKIMGKLRNKGLRPWLDQVKARSEGKSVLVLVSVVGMKSLVKLKPFDWVWNGFEWLKGDEFIKRIN